MLKIIQKRNIFLTISGILVGLSLFGFIFYGLNLGIDFTGGSLLEVEFKTERPDNSEIKDVLAGFDLGTVSVQATGENGVILRFKDIDENTHQAILQKLDVAAATRGSARIENGFTRMEEEVVDGREGEDGEPADASGSASVATSAKEAEAMAGEGGDPAAEESAIDERRFESVGPAIGKELKARTLKAILFALIAIVIYVAWVFRHVSRSISSWKYGICAIIALFHDIAIVVGVFVVLGIVRGIEVNTPFVAALLTILGYSVNDTIVIFDRIRENLPKRSEGFEDIVNISINESLTRSINTSLTTFVALFAIYLFGGATIQNFILALLIGVIAGTYSSIFVASAVLVIWQSRNK